MKNMTVIHLFLLILVFAAEKSMAAPSGSSTELQLVLQWPTSYCNTGRKCVDHVPLEFKVHGLWLCKNSRSVNFNGPAYCEELKMSKDLQNYLYEHWPNLNSQTPRDYLWLHEYIKHGSGVAFHNQVHYFETARTIATKIGDVLQMRLRGGRKLTRGAFYKADDFKRVGIAGRELVPRLQCNSASGRAYPQLLEIAFCADTNNNLKNCKYSVGRCSRQWQDSKGYFRRGFKFP